MFQLMALTEMSAVWLVAICTVERQTELLWAVTLRLCTFSVFIWVTSHDQTLMVAYQILVLALTVKAYTVSCIPGVSQACSLKRKIIACWHHLWFYFLFYFWEARINQSSQQAQHLLCEMKTPRTSFKVTSCWSSITNENTIFTNTSK